MAGPIAEAFIQVRADTDRFGPDLQRGTADGLDDLGDAVDSLGERIEDALREAARQSSDDLEAMFDRLDSQLERLVDEVQFSGERIEDAFAEAARASDESLDNIGGASLAGVAAEAELVGERVEGSFQEAARQSNAHLATIGAVGLAGVAAAGTAAVAAIGGLAFVGVNAAADLGESINAINVTLGDGAEGFLAFSQGAADNLGLTQAALNQAVIPMGALLRNAGLEGEELSGSLTDLAQRAADTGSVMNRDVNEVLEAFGAAVRGELEPARALGVSFNDAAVQAKALELGLVGAGEEADDAAKTQARLALVMEQTAQNAGDFANTADSLPNMLRRLKATGEEAAASLGTALIPGGHACAGGWYFAVAKDSKNPQAAYKFVEMRSNEGIKPSIRC